MCRFIDRNHGVTFVETIRIENGRISNLFYHNARLNQTRAAWFASKERLDLANYIQPAPYLSRTKCRVVYADRILGVEYSPYHLRPVGSFTLVTDDKIDYSYKKVDRSRLNELFSQRGDRDEILIVREGLLTDTSICNVALWDGEEWITPARPLLPGTMRAALLERGVIRAADIPVDELGKCQKIRMFNALIDFGEVEIEL